jgi:4-hydroxyacetophenone monooxygenase
MNIVASRPMIAMTQNGVNKLDHVDPIVASDAEIAAAVTDADLPALLAALATLTNDENLLAEDLRSPPARMGASIRPQGGMSADAQDKARRLALQALIAYRDKGAPPPAAGSPLLERAMQFLARGAGAEYLPLLKHELALPSDLGAPDWTKADIAAQRDFSVAVIGAGLSGVAAAYRLHQAGVPYTVFEKNPDVGGVWWDNVYPGCRLDTPNFAYSYSFAQKQDWPEQFSRQVEIQKYISRVADDTSVRARIAFETEVVSLSYDDGLAKWAVKTRDAKGQIETEMFNAIITATGQLNRPAYPDIPGLESFEGKLFHSARWPKGLDIRNKRVAVIGTGASAYQIVPSIVDDVSELQVFQRNPPWMLPTPNYHEEIKPGMAWLLQHVPYYGRWFRFWQFWIAAEGRLPLVEVEPGWDHPISVGSANEGLRLECIEHLQAQLADRPDLLHKLTPAYPPGAKRMLRDNGVWTGALKRPNTSLITDQILRIEDRGIVTHDGKLHETDVIVLATGFEASDYLTPINVVGREGKNLHDWWAGDCRAYLGITMPGFPNLFMTGGPTTGVVVNGSAIFSAECAVEYALSAIHGLLAGGYAAMDVRPGPFDAFNKRVDAGNLTKAWGVAKVSSWYKNRFGRASQTWPFSLLEYWRLTERADLTDYELIKPEARSGVALA